MKTQKFNLDAPFFTKTNAYTFRNIKVTNTIQLTVEKIIDQNDKSNNRVHYLDIHFVIIWS